MPHENPRFTAPYLISEELEFVVPLLNIYATPREFGLIAILNMLVYAVLRIMINNNLVPLVVASLGAILTGLWITRCKRFLPESWLWDVFVGAGVMTSRRGFMKPPRSRVLLAMHHIPRTEAFTGAAGAALDVVGRNHPQCIDLPLTAFRPFREQRRQIRWRRDAEAPVPAQVAHLVPQGLYPPSVPLGHVWEHDDS